MRKAITHFYRGLGLACLLFLVGCASPHNATIKKSHRDQAPAFYIDASQVHNAIPKTEPRSHYGNPHSYTIVGKRYYVLKSARHYNKVGYASWYGTRFHGKLTSSREPYNMFDMTAASKTLPLPTYVKVTNLENGRSVVVKVNDRGPFKRKRIIDLSYVAARKLGYARKGTALVRVTAINPRRWRAHHTHPLPEPTHANIIALK